MGKKVWPSGLQSDTGMFDVEITPKKLTCEEGENANCCAFNHPSSGNGAHCALHILYKGNMDYLHRSIVEDWPMPTE